MVNIKYYFDTDSLIQDKQNIPSYIEGLAAKVLFLLFYICFSLLIHI